MRMNNITYQPGDRVMTNVNGVEVEASVVKLSVDVEVRTADGKVWWRALSRVRPPQAGNVAPVTAGDSTLPNTATPKGHAGISDRSPDTAQESPQAASAENATLVETTVRESRKGRKGRR